MHYIFIVFVMFFFSGCSEPTNNNSYTQSSNQPIQPNYNSQLALATRTRYKTQKVMNYNELKLYRVLKSELEELDYIIAPQVSLGEILTHDDKETYLLTVNSKRVDFCIMDSSANPIAIIEYNGEGHYDETSASRDNIKRIATESAGLKFINITHHDKNDFRLAVRTKIKTYLQS